MLLQVIDAVLQACLSTDPRNTAGIGGDNMTCMVVLLDETLPRRLREEKEMVKVGVPQMDTGSLVPTSSSVSEGVTPAEAPPDNPHPTASSSISPNNSLHNNLDVINNSIDLLATSTTISPTRKLAREPALSPITSQHGQSTTTTTTTNTSTTTSTSSGDNLSHASQDEKYHNIEEDDGDGDGGGDVKIDNASTHKNTFWSTLIGMGSSGNSSSSNGGGDDGEGERGLSSSLSTEVRGLSVDHIAVTVHTPASASTSCNATPPPSSTITSPSEGNSNLLMTGSSPSKSTTSSIPSDTSGTSDSNGDDADSTMYSTMEPNIDITKREVKFKLGTLRPSKSPSS